MTDDHIMRPLLLDLAEKDAEIARLTAERNRLRDEVVRLRASNRRVCAELKDAAHA